MLEVAPSITVETKLIWTEEEAHEALNILLEGMLQRRNMLVGFDVHSDSSPTHRDHRIILLKFCTEHVCVLVRLKSGIDYIQPSVRKFLEFKDAIFAGVHIGQDIEKLRKGYGVYVGNAVELTDLAADCRPSKPYLKAYGVRELSREVLNIRFHPKPASVVWSDWCQNFLSLDQMKSAAMDAYAAYKIGQNMLSFRLLI
ncbi:Protein RISC-INTERACTING CLEARING 3'-5' EXORIBONUCLEASE 1 [Linum perenne]